METRIANQNDLRAVAELAAQMWGSHTVEELEADFAELMQQEAMIFLAICDGKTVGFAQCQLRHDYVEGTQSSPVGYLEGIFVAKDHRKQGAAKLLLETCEAWAKEQGCREFASDCEVDNRDSLAFHLSMGFEEANRIICFTKKL